MKIVGKRWQIDLHAQHEAHLQLSAVNLPGSVQKKKTLEDELQMRERFKEGDLISVRICIILLYIAFLQHIIAPVTHGLRPDNSC